MMRYVRRAAAGMMMAAAITMLVGCGPSRDQSVTTPTLGAVQLSGVTATATDSMVFTGKYQVRLSNVTTTAGATSNEVAAAGNVLTATAVTLSDVAPGQFLIDIVSNSDKNGVATNSISAFIFKKYIVSNFGNGETVSVPVTIDATDTAKAYAYASWPKAKSKTIAQFTPNTASLSALVATMTVHLKKSSGKISSAFKWTPAIASLALQLGKVTP